MLQKKWQRERDASSKKDEEKIIHIIRGGF